MVVVKVNLAPKDAGGNGLMKTGGIEAKPNFQPLKLPMPKRLNERERHCYFAKCMI